MIKKGTVKIVDRYKGPQLIKKVYKGSDLVFDAFSEITGNLPLSFNARAQDALKNYRVYGTAVGAGVPTINLLDINATDTSNGYVANAYLNISGEAIVSGVFDVSEYIPVNSGTRYSYCGAKRNEPAICFYDSSKQFLSSLAYTYARPRRFTTPSTAAYVRISIYDNRDMLLLGEYDETPDFEPYGYKIPLTLASSPNTDTYPLYIGGTKLSEEEYADFGEQKVYKRTENYFPRTIPTSGGKRLNADGSISSASYWITTDYIPVSGRTFTLSPVASNSVNASICAYDSNKNLIKGQAYGTISDTPYDVTISCDSDVSFIRLCYYTKVVAKADIMLVEGSTAPETYIPYLQPTDPPTPLPAIIAYEGENTLDSTETVGEVGEVMVKGRISETAMLGRPS